MVNLGVLFSIKENLNDIMLGFQAELPKYPSALVQPPPKYSVYDIRIIYISRK